MKTGSNPPTLTALAENAVMKTGSNPPTLKYLAENAVMKTGSNPHTLTFLSENNNNTNDNIDRLHGQGKCSWKRRKRDYWILRRI